MSRNAIACGFLMDGKGTARYRVAADSLISLKEFVRPVNCYKSPYGLYVDGLAIRLVDLMERVGRIGNPSC
jgi:hypothetical protein